jgi:hypothetical protein
MRSYRALGTKATHPQRLVHPRPFLVPELRLRRPRMAALDGCKHQPYPKPRVSLSLTCASIPSKQTGLKPEMETRNLKAYITFPSSLSSGYLPDLSESQRLTMDRGSNSVKRTKPQSTRPSLPSRGSHPPGPHARRQDIVLSDP